MTVDEAEKLAGDVVELDGHTALGEGRIATDLARFVLAVLPVVRAASECDKHVLISWAVWMSSKNNPTRSHSEMFTALRDALSALRAAMEGK